MDHYVINLKLVESFWETFEIVSSIKAKDEVNHIRDVCEFVHAPRC